MMNVSPKPKTRTLPRGSPPVLKTSAKTKMSSPAPITSPPTANIIAKKPPMGVFVRSFVKKLSAGGGDESGGDESGDAEVDTLDFGQIPSGRAGRHTGVELAEVQRPQMAPPLSSSPVPMRDRWLLLDHEAVESVFTPAQRFGFVLAGVAGSLASSWSASAGRSIQ